MKHLTDQNKHSEETNKREEFPQVNKKSLQKSTENSKFKVRNLKLSL